MKLTEDFYLDEFHCKDGTEVPDNMLDNIQEVANNLQELRDYIGVPITITSGYRSPDYNESIGGVKFSRHTMALAADLKVRGVSPRRLADAIDYLISEGRMKQGGLGRYKTFTHYDIRGTRARWNHSG
jgi:uncharacterized protein YcbK (DUF882 family)